jgi:hypothetical protein
VKNKEWRTFPLSNTPLKTALSFPPIQYGIIYLYKIKIFVLGEHHFTPPFFRMSAGKRQKEDLF